MERQKVAAITRGEYLSAILLGALIDFPVIDARDLIEMNGQGEVQEEETRERIKRALKGEKCAVIPGFYGQNGAGNLCLLPRGGSDFTGSIIAEALEANLYENYTDVSGIFQADPNLFCEAKPIEEITYRELASLAVHGARVLQYESIAPCERGRIPIRVCNSFRPGDAGTMVLDRHGESFSPCYALSGKCHPDSAELFIAAIGNAKCKVFPEKILSFKKEEAEIGMLYRGSKEDFPSAMKSAYAWIAARSG